MELRRIKFFGYCAVNFLVWVCFSFYPVNAMEYPWQARIDKDGVSVSTRKVEGSAILEYKAKVVVNAPIEKVIALYEDEKKIPQWFAQCRGASLVENESPEQKIYYFVLHLPWPVSERDSVYRQIKSVDAVTKAVSYTTTALPNRMPRTAGRVRVLDLKSLWRFTPLADGRTEIYFQQHSNPGGFIPALVVNRLVVDIPYNSLKNLRKLIMSQKVA